MSNSKARQGRSNLASSFAAQSAALVRASSPSAQASVDFASETERRIELKLSAEREKRQPYCPPLERKAQVLESHQPKYADLYRLSAPLYQKQSSVDSNLAKEIFWDSAYKHSRTFLKWSIGIFIAVHILYVGAVFAVGTPSKLGYALGGFYSGLFQGVVYGWDSLCENYTCDAPGDTTRYGVVE